MDSSIIKKTLKGGKLMDLQESVERMHSGKLYYADAPKLVAEQMVYLDKVFAYNQLPPSKQEEKQGLNNF